MASIQLVFLLESVVTSLVNVELVVIVVIIDCEIDSNAIDVRKGRIAGLQDARTLWLQKEVVFRCGAFEDRITLLRRAVCVLEDGGLGLKTEILKRSVAKGSGEGR